MHLWQIYTFKDIKYNLREDTTLLLPESRTISYGNDSLLFRASMLWNSVLNKIKQSASVISRAGEGGTGIAKFANNL